MHIHLQIKHAWSPVTPFNMLQYLRDKLIGRVGLVAPVIAGIETSGSGSSIRVVQADFISVSEKFKSGLIP